MVDKDEDSAFSSYAQNGDLSLNNRENSVPSDIKVSSSPSNIRSPSVPPLAPLEYLQSQRRGSITDPSLHASPGHFSRPSNLTAGPSSTPSDLLSAPHHSPPKRALSNSRPTSPSRMAEGPSMATDQPYDRTHNSLSSSDGIDSTRAANPPSRRASFDAGGTSQITEHNPLQADHSNIDSKPRSAHTQAHASAGQQGHIDSVAPSVISQGPHAQTRGPGSPSSLPHGTKRKLSHDRGVLAAAGEDIDPQLVGPGVPSTVHLDMEGPIPKRRGSLAETQRITGLSVYDRRHSLDTRIAQGSPQWWGSERRDSTSSMFSSPSMGYGSPAFSADSPHGRTPATVAWHPTQASDQPSAMQNEADTSGTGRQFDPSSMMPITMVHPLAFNTDRRMSVPTNLPSNMPPANSTTARVLRSRSRPPSRTSQLRGAESGAASSSNAALQNVEDTDSAEQVSGSSSIQNLQPPSGSTPYSRSPELRVSHKLAERKRRKEMRDLFDELRDQLPADRGMKASKWEILSKAIDFVVHLKQSHQEMARDIEMLRHELESIRQGIPSFGPGGPHPVMYSQGPHVVPGHYPLSSGPAMPPHQPSPGPTHQPPPPHQQTLQQTLSRPASSQNVFPPGGGSVGVPPQNGNAAVTSNEKTEAPSM